MKLISIQRDPSYAPGSYLVVQEGYSTRDDDHTRLVSVDWDFPSVAANLGFEPCFCGATDGTVDCQHKTASQMIVEAADFLDEHLGELFEDPGYFDNE